ncbi:bifunctional folylpolyglutamate synthase/dihydrofolate synthase [Pseudonocardia humida]|uniref:tetrahydrofolate synthase n=1 Tax=Pseudonocardia humida TaxID=2800819 RepID=A0ABT0ZTS6_9PSEU|nr:Mur ligase family protein [Pseudonocardia humida]MCO1654135.1 dihydrofolate synthase [Pseudonocardia humida]
MSGLAGGPSTSAPVRPAPGPGPADPADLAEVERALLARWPENRLEPSLDRIRAVVAALDHPQRALPVVHVTGTNGKTTTASMIDGLLRASGLSVGRFTSPHLESVRERIVVDGEPVDEARFVEVYRLVRPALERVDRAGAVPVSFFEAITAMAVVAFVGAGVDVAVVEVGMGGSWDATNVLDGEVAVLTPIALDHTEYLGPDEVAIAGEKAGIIKAGATAVLAAQLPEVERVVHRRASGVGARVRAAADAVELVARAADPDGQTLHLRTGSVDLPGLRLPLLGAHQGENARVAMAAVEEFLARRDAGLDPAAVRRALAAVVAPGRLEVVRRDPPVLVDASHNPHGMAVTAAALAEARPATRLAVVLAVLEGKDATGMLEALRGCADLVVVTTNGSPRCTRPADLAGVAREVLGADRVLVEPHLAAALDRALRWARPGGAGDRPGVLVTGSVVTAGHARTLLRGHPGDHW